MDINELNATSQTPRQTRQGGHPHAQSGQTPPPRADQLELSDQARLLNQVEQSGLEWGRAFATLPATPRSASELRQHFEEFAANLARVEWGRSFTTVPPIPRTATELNQWLDDQDSALRERVGTIFQQQGLNLESGLSLQTDEAGMLQADPNHPQAAAAQAALDAHPEISAQAQELGQRRQLAAVLALGGELRRADNPGQIDTHAQALSQQLQQPQAHPLHIPATNAVQGSDPLQSMQA